MAKLFQPSLLLAVMAVASWAPASVSAAGSRILVSDHSLPPAGGGHQSFLRQPFDQVATVGQHVTLPCRVVNKQGVLQWTRDDFGLGSERDLIGFDRYAMTGSDEEGDWTLDIMPVTLEDDAEFQCQVGAAEDGRVEPIRSRYATLTVLVPPTPPRIVHPSSQPVRTHTSLESTSLPLHKTVEGRMVELVCESRGGKPAAEITWFNDRNEVIQTGVRTRTELMEDNKRFVTISHLKFPAKVEHHNRNFTCQAQNSAIRQPQSVSTRLQVHYPPHVTLKSDQPDFVTEGTRVRYSCEAHANPSQVAYAWYVGGRRVQDAHSSQLVLEKVTRGMHNHVVKCEVTNPIGKTEEATVINISYPPMFIQRPISLAGDQNERVSLTCLVDSNPPPTYAWYRMETAAPKKNLGTSDQGAVRRRLVGESANLTLMVSPETVGEYICQSSSSGAPAPGGDGSVEPVVINASAKIYLKDKPKISAGNRVQYANLETIGRVVCTAVSVPTVETVEWFYSGGLPVMTGNGGKFSVLENRSNDGVRSVLVIAGVQEEDLGKYTCRVTNSLGTDSAVLTLQQHAALSLVVVSAGVLGGLFLTVAIILAIVVCRRRRHSGQSKLGGGTSSDIAVVINKKDPNNPGGGGPTSNGLNRTAGLGSASTASTSDDDGAASNDSSELNKAEVRTSSSLSGPPVGPPDGADVVDSWIDGNAAAVVAGEKASVVNRNNNNRAILSGSGGVVPPPIHSIHHPMAASSSNYAHVHSPVATANGFNKSANSISTANYSLSPPMPSTVPSYGSAGSSYYGSNLTGNYGNYATYSSHQTYITSSPAGGVAQQQSTYYGGGHHHLHGLPAAIATPSGDAKSTSDLYVAPPMATTGQQQQQYSLHVRASPISPTYSQFSNGVSVKNCYPTFEKVKKASNGGGGGNTLIRGLAAKTSVGSLSSGANKSVDHTDNYSVYVNSTSGTGPAGQAAATTASLATVANSSLATHV